MMSGSPHSACSHYDLNEPRGGGHLDFRFALVENFMTGEKEGASVSYGHIST